MPDYLVFPAQESDPDKPITTYGAIAVEADNEPAAITKVREASREQLRRDHGAFVQADQDYYVIPAARFVIHSKPVKV